MPEGRGVTKVRAHSKQRTWVAATTVVMEEGAAEEVRMKVKTSTTESRVERLARKGKKSLIGRSTTALASDKREPW